ncbi:MAG: radical SAM protein [Deltaproteobacteria bacterium]|nr:radical SAM protein [Deltaproteobacteria bacterium]
MWRLGKDLRLLARLALELRPDVAAFHARYEVARRLRPGRLGAPSLPTALYIETSAFCRGRCRGCYVPVRERRSATTLDQAAIARALAGARRLRPDYVCLVGGEPLDGPALAVNLAMVDAAPDLRFLLCTGGHGRCDADLMRQLAARANVAVLFSVDGRAATHDRIRGAGSHGRMVAAMRSYNGRRGQVCGASVTLRRENHREVTEPAFFDELETAGCNLFAFDVCFARRGAGAVTAPELAAAIDRLRRVAARGRSALFVNPYGRVRAAGLDQGGGMMALSIDCHGTIFGSRRGAPLGSLAAGGLEAILSGEAFQRSQHRLGLGGCAADDPRRELFQQTLGALANMEAGAGPVAGSRSRPPRVPPPTATRPPPRAPAAPPRRSPPPPRPAARSGSSGRCPPAPAPCPASTAAPAPAAAPPPTLGSTPRAPPPAGGRGPAAAGQPRAR